MTLSPVPRRIHGLLIVALAIAACESPEPRADAVSAAADTIGVRAAIDSLAANVERANEMGDAELYAASWARDAIMVMSGNPPIHGRDSIVAAFRRRPPLPPGARMTIHPTETQIMGPDWAYVMGVDTFSFTPRGAANPVTQTSTFIVVLRKTAEGWQTYREVLATH